MPLETVGGAEVYIHDGVTIASEQDALDVIGEVYGRPIAAIVLPVERLSPDFFRLSTGLAGAVLQKLINYGQRVAVMGPIGPQLEASKALRDFVRESNRGTHVMFVADRDELAARLRK